jgi:hypothetical protein
MTFSLAFRNLARTRMNPWNIANSADSASKTFNEQFPVYIITIVKEVQYNLTQVELLPIWYIKNNRSAR